MNKYRLMSPGPTQVPHEVLLSMADTLIHHRTPQFKSILNDVNLKLRKVFRTENPVLILSSSGTGAMETSVSNFLSSGDKALVINGGKFGGRFAEICAVHGIEVVPYDLEWSEAADAEVVKRMLKNTPGIKAVYSTLCETSTGVVNDIRKIGSAVSATDAILVVDAISGLSADKMFPDEWGVDVVICGSQKGLMLPPGLAFLSVSPKAEKAAEASDLPKFYFDVKKALKAHKEDDTPWTPAISLIFGLSKVLDIMLAEGLDNILERHSCLAHATRESMKAMGLEIFAKRPSNALTAVRVPDNIDAKILTANLRDIHGMTVAGGQGHLKGRIFRLGHLGYVDEYDMVSAVAAVESALIGLGHGIEPGRGVSKMRECLEHEGAFSK